VDSKRLARPLTVGAAVFVILLLLPVVLLALYYRVVPNIIEAPVHQLWQLSGYLFSSNTGAALRLLLSQPVTIVGRAEIDTGLRVWEVYAYPVPNLILLAGALHGGVIAMSVHRQRRRRVQVAAGLLLMAIGLSYVRVVACCTGPGWAIDVWLRGLALTPSPGSLIDWSAWYQRIEPLFLPAQAALVVGGVALITLAGRNSADKLRAETGGLE
jgi:hypothetical protein